MRESREGDVVLQLVLPQSTLMHGYEPAAVNEMAEDVHSGLSDGHPSPQQHQVAVAHNRGA